MHCLRSLRIPSLGSASVRLGLRTKPEGLRSKSASCISIRNNNYHQQPDGNAFGGSSSSNSSIGAGSAACLSTSAKRYQDIPKRIYQSAPKRNHGKNAGMRKWSTPNKPGGTAAAAAEPAAIEGDNSSSSDQQEEMLALGRGGGARAAEDLREISTALKEIRVSPWSLNLLAKLVRGLPVVEASAQLQFCKKKHTSTVRKAIQNALNLADMRYGLAAEQMMVGKIYVTKGHVVKRMRIMGRGRAGIQTRKWSHLNVTLREIDFDALIDGADSKRRREKLAARKEEVAQLLAARGE